MELLERLRQHTHEAHEALHVHPLLAPLNHGAITMAQYRAIIAAFRMAYDRPEREKKATSFPDSPVTDWLDNDIQRHHIRWHAYTDLPMLDLSSDSRMAGYLYVKQGSTLGGQFISKHLAQTLGLEAGRDNRFFHGYGKDTGRLWQEFRHWLAIQTNLDHHIVLESALSAFQNIRLCADHVLLKLNETPRTADGRRA